MDKKTVAVSAVVSAAVGTIVAVAACLIFVFFVLRQPEVVVANEPPKPTPTPKVTSIEEIQVPEIKADDMKSIAIRTGYPGYFESGSRCAKTYNEYFGNEDGMGSSSSPCYVTVTFDREGNAAKSIVISRWDKTLRQKKVVETNVWKGKVTAEQFAALTKLVAENDAFKNWREGTSLYVSNCTIDVEHTNGTRSPMSNVGPTATAYLPMVNAIKELDAQTNWQKTE